MSCASVWPPFPSSALHFGTSEFRACAVLVAVVNVLCVVCVGSLALWCSFSVCELLVGGLCALCAVSALSQGSWRSFSACLVLLHSGTASCHVILTPTWR